MNPKKTQTNSKHGKQLFIPYHSAFYCSLYKSPHKNTVASGIHQKQDSMGSEITMLIVSQ